MTTTTTAAHPHATTLTTPQTVITILTDACDWQEPVREAARLAADSGRRLKVVLADGGELLAAAALGCVQLVGSRGPVRAIDTREAARLLKAQVARLRRELDLLGRRFGIEVEITTLDPGAAAFWAGSSALTVFSRRRRGAMLVVHAGTTATLEIAARLAASRRQTVRLLTAATDTPAKTREDIFRLFGRHLVTPAAVLPPDAALPALGSERVAALVLDPVYVEARRQSVDALLAEIRALLKGGNS